MARRCRRARPGIRRSARPISCSATAKTIGRLASARARLRSLSRRPAHRRDEHRGAQEQARRSPTRLLARAHPAEHAQPAVERPLWKWIESVSAQPNDWSWVTSASALMTELRVRTRGAASSINGSADARVRAARRHDPALVGDVRAVDHPALAALDRRHPVSAWLTRKLPHADSFSVAPFATGPPTAATSGCSAWASTWARHQPGDGRQWSSVSAITSPRATDMPTERIRKIDAPGSVIQTISGFSAASCSGKPRRCCRRRSPPRRSRAPAGRRSRSSGRAQARAASCRGRPRAEARSRRLGRIDGRRSWRPARRRGP